MMKNTVWIVTRLYDYEGFTIIGVFGTEEAANTVVEEDKKENNKYADGWEVEEWDVN